LTKDPEIIDSPWAMPIVRGVGRADCGAVLLVHGTPGDQSFFHKLFALAPPGWLVAGVDLPDHGRAADEPSLELDPFDRDLDLCVAALPRPLIVVGSSLGAYLVARLLGRAGDRIDRAVLIGGLASLPAELAAGREQLADAIETGQMAPAAVADLAVQLYLGGEGDPEDESLVRKFMSRLPQDRLVRSCRRFARVARAAPLRSFSTPTVVVHAYQDPALPHALGVALAKVAPMTQLVSLPGSSHLPHLTKPVQIAGIVFSDPVEGHMRSHPSR
jgi:pimeloyl-[acyl-carrier protein] methyl ester esterase